MSYSCVKFFEDGIKKIMTVPSNWVMGDNVYWPKKNVNRHHKSCADPQEDWLEIEIYKEVYRGIYLNRVFLNKIPLSLPLATIISTNY